VRYGQFFGGQTLLIIAGHVAREIIKEFEIEKIKYFPPNE
jgi:hypothetical protein